MHLLNGRKPYHERQIFPLCDFNMTIDMTLDLLRQQSR